MMLKKQAKILTDKQIKAVLAYLDTTKGVSIWRVYTRRYGISWT